VNEPDLAPDLARCRSYLLAIARVELPRYLRAKDDASDVVQLALLEAHRDRDQFNDHGDDAKLRAWLRTILAHKLANLIRYNRQEKRDVNRERALEQSLAASSSRLEAWLADLGTLPPDRAARNEQVLALAEALVGLPDAQREAVELRFLDGLPVKEIADRLGKTTTAVAGLLHRGLAALRDRLRDEPEGE